ncbi:protein ASPARTIC PROTEASE IN GUARD CELL 2-like isoform X1 [Panicum miliaceum]|uniref:Protein ASPARTIC PROTEASE IN GUARD CELL 2-like isoform X1 n=1 Tax=Panicum miliaceum TaxID=4540 RepID=A0A3L6QGC6_PANMI|nr:protein ASPARTIC PROTEASE IN GUARD CELL 2-like isoform X1 [Panicum miliaceum]
MASVPKLLLLLLCSYHTLVAHAGVDSSYKLLSIGSLKSDSVCSEPKATPSSSGVTVPLHHRHGPCSPAPSKKAPALEEMLRRDQLRAAYIQRKFSASKGVAGDVEQSDATVPTTLGTSLNTLEYVITVGIGSPAATQTMLIDTGSDVSWVQCKPCSQCHSQADPLFDPSSSSTYSPFSCSSATCAQLGQEGNGCSSSQCQYIVTYGDGSSTTGTYSSDTLALGSNTVRNFQFGCSHAIRVGGKQLNIPASVFSAGTVMDSGTVITRLPRTAYSALSSAFKAGMKQYPSAPPSGIFDTCFDFSGQSTISIPTVELVFSGGAVVDLAGDGIILSSCLAFAGNSDDSSLGIIGNVQQRTFEVLYDVGGGAVGFKAGAC